MSRETKATAGPLPQNERRWTTIRNYVNDTIHEMIDESHEWVIKHQTGVLGPEPKWQELRDAVLSVLFAVEHESGRQECEAEDG